MCEDVATRRVDLLTVLEACGLHQRASMLPPAERLIRQLVEEVYRNSVSIGLFSTYLQRLCLGLQFFSVDFLGPNSFSVSLQADHMPVAENGSELKDRSQMIRDRLHSKM